MATEKPRGAPKVEWTAAVLMQLGGAGVLAILSILFCWLAFSNWRFKSNLVEGYQEVARGRPSSAKPAPPSCMRTAAVHSTFGAPRGFSVAISPPSKTKR